MLKKVIVKLNIVLLVIMTMFCINTVSYAIFTPQVDLKDGATKILKSIRYGSLEGRETMISYEKLATDPGIWCRQHGVFLTSEYSPSRPNKDATLEVNGMTRVIKELNASNIELGKTRGDAYSTNPYGANGSKYADVYTLGKFKVDKVVDSRAADVFIDVLSRDYPKSTSNYPNELQSARWGVLQTKPGLGSSSISASGSGSNEIQKAALKFESVLKEQEQFLASHNNAASQVTTDYSKMKVAYNKNKGTVLVGPFTIDYVFGVYHPNTPIQSSTKITNDNGDIEFSVVNDLKFFADDGLRKEIKNYKIIYPNRDKANQDYVKTDDRENVKYTFPLPKEEFYVEFNDAEYKNVDAFARMQVFTKHMSAQGRHEELVGTADHIAYNSKSVPIPCTSTSTIPNTNRCALHPEHNVGDGHARAYTYSVEAKVLEKVIVQPTYHILNSSLSVPQKVVTTELGTQATPTSSWMPMIIPLPLSYNGRARNHEYTNVPVLPDEPNPNEPIPDNPEPEPVPEPEPEIKLTFDIAGTVWLDSLTGKESLPDGVMGEDEEKMQNVIVRLYQEGEAKPVRETLTDKNGRYIFQFVRVGYDYYVEFTYDGMTYTTTKYLGSQYTSYSAESDASAISGINQTYKADPSSYKNNSHAIEDSAERTSFNSKFQVISNNQAMGTAGVIPLTYKTYMSEQGAVSALITTDENYIVADDFKMKASTKTAGLMYLLDENYVASESDLDLTQVGEEYYYHATYPGTLHINLGLVKRPKADFAVKNDLSQIITRTEGGKLDSDEYNGKSTSALTFDASTRNSAYYTGDVIVHKIDKATYDDKLDASKFKGTQDIKDEIDAYIEYKFIIRNQSITQLGSVLELTNHFDSDLEYATSYDITDLTSWIETNMIDANKEVYREPITWTLEPSTKDGYTTIKTTGLKDKVLISGETIEVHLLLKVKKDGNRNLLMDLGNNEFKDNVLEISQYTFNEGMIDKDSNPGNVELKNYNTYEDDTDIAPHVKFEFKGDSQNPNEDEKTKFGNIISGNVWEDLANQVMPNNLYTGNGKADENEKGIPNVKVELIRVMNNKYEYIEREAIRTDANGQYKFTNLPTGMYKVKFTFGDEEQLSKDKTFNGQDYKAVSTDTLKQYFENPSMEVMILADTSEGMLQKGVQDILGVSAKSLIESLYSNVQKVKIGATLFSEPKTGGDATVGLTTKPEKNNVLALFDNITPNTGSSLESAINSSIEKYTEGAAAKVMIICTDGYISSNAKSALNRAAENGIKVISIVDSTDVWPKDTFGTEAAPTTGNLYYVRNVNIPHYISKIALEDTLEYISNTLPNILEAKEIQKGYEDILEKSEVGDIYTRQKSIDYTKSMTYENGSIVNGEKTKNLSEFSKNTQVTAITPIRHIMIDHNNADTSNVNLGLIERPRTELQIREEIAGIQVKLANGETIIDTEKDMTKNVQILQGSRDNIFMDKEIMQGATLEVKYRITVFNNGHVDTLGEYFDYDMYNGPIAEKYNKAISTDVGTLYSYYTNLTFRAEDNSNMPIEKNGVVTDIKTDGTKLSNWKEYIKENGTRKDGMKNDGVQTPKVEKVDVLSAEDGKTQVMRDKAVWESKSRVRTGVENDERFANGSVKVVQTTSLGNVHLYPVESVDVIAGKEVASASTYLVFSKTISTNDTTDTMTYKQSVEIVERLNDVGRRDYEAVPGNYVPHSDIKEYDSAKVEDIYILPPFGENMQNYFALAIGATVLLGVGVIFVKRKIVK